MSFGASGYDVGVFVDRMKEIRDKVLCLVVERKGQALQQVEGKLALVQRQQEEQDIPTRLLNITKHLDTLEKKLGNHKSES
mmetsp:Transcript_14746/g.16689  ORF Transcript_14746/g.16689 Transcript_14746/m.16689 type:complete len:81 (-) Transcript_14746:541-783(-)